ncbi:MAG: phosphoglycerate dehydrogenase [Planctomycetota bacterium]
MTTAAPPRTFKILAADKLAPEGLAAIESEPDAELVNKPGLTEAEYADLLAAGGIEAMIVRSGIQVTPAMLENPGDLKVIARAGVGVDNIDLPAATAKGIVVVNTAEASTLTTAEHAFALMMALARNIGPAYRRMTEGGWDRSKFQGRQLAGKKLGVVGFGRIGRAVAERALAFEMDVAAFDPVYPHATALDGRVKMVSDFQELIPTCDILTFHVPLNDHTRGMLGDDAFGKCKKGVMVVNAARGGVVDEQAVLRALDSGQCGGAALDVFTSEPPPEDSPLRSHPKLLVTPHLGASTKEAQQAVSVDAAAACLAFLRGQGVRGAVNAPGLRVDLDPTQKVFVDLASRMGSLLAPMITRGMARVEVEACGETPASIASMIQRSALVGLLTPHLADPVNLVNAASVAEARGIELRTVESDQPGARGPHVVVTVHPPRGADTDPAHPADRTRRIVGQVFDDLRPRVVEINGYAMDMVPEGPMMILLNEDRPGMIGLVGREMGEAGVNIADMTISRRTGSDGQRNALQVLKLDEPAPPAVLEQMARQPGIDKVAQVVLGPAPK